MKKFFFLLFFVALTVIANAQFKPFRFAFISDTHIGSPNGGAEEDLRRTINDINRLPNIAFVVVTGDITELGTNEEIKLAKQILDSLRIPYYVIPGNHDTGWSESGGLSFTKIFGYDKFSFEYNGVKFLGCASGPYVRMSDGHIPREAVIWLDKELKKTSSKQPLIFLNHYPLDSGLDNWYEVTDRIKKKNTLLALCGHGHANSLRNWEGIRGVMGRSNLRAKAAFGGYNLVDVRTDSIVFTERTPVKETMRTWATIAVQKQILDTGKVVRPDFSINKQYPNTKTKWVYSSAANVVSTPAVINELVVFGNSNGSVEAVSLGSGKRKWSFPTNGPIYSSPALFENSIIVGSSDGYIYSVNGGNGKLIWKLQTEAAVLGSPVVEDGLVFIGGSDHKFRAIDAKSGKEIWAYNGINGPVVAKPIVYEDKVIFGAWDTYLHALNINDGKLVWKWNNGSTVPNYSPAACTPVATDGVVYVVAPDRYITAIDIEKGTTLWRDNEATVRESIGISADKEYIYAKTMNDFVVAYPAGKQKQTVAWKVNCGYGYDHVPSMLLEKGNNIIFGTRSGVVYAVDKQKKEIAWAHKIDNSMANTVSVLDQNRVIASTMDGKVSLIVSQ